MRAHACGVPVKECFGGNILANRGIRNDITKVHTTPNEAFRCYTAYLERQGYKRLSSRLYQLGDGPVMVLTKPCRFGAPLRRGKSANKGGQGKTVTPLGGRSGIIISK